MPSLVPMSDATLPPWPQSVPEPDPLAAARGVMWSLLFSMPVWVLIALTGWWLST